MVTIYMPLLNEGVEVWRPVEATHVADDRYRVAGTAPEGEEWQFPPGSIVACELKTVASGEQRLTAIERVDDGSN